MSIGRHVLITGATGFIGRRVVGRFLDQGWRVTAHALPGEAPLSQWQGRVAMLNGDLASPGAFDGASPPADTLVHLASVVGLPGEYEHQWQVIAQGTEQVMDTAARWRARVVVVSSIAVYGDKIQTQVCRESDGHGAWQGAYGRAKQAQERLALEIAERHRLALTIVRPANVYGVGGRSAWGDQLLQALQDSGGGVVGDAERHDAGLVYVENLADALWLAATDTRAIGRTFNVCDGLRVSWRRFLDDMAALVGRPPPPAYPLAPLLAAARANEDPARLVPPKDPSLPFLEALNLVGFDNRIDSTLIRRTLGWSPRMGYEAALAEIAAQR